MRSHLLFFAAGMLLIRLTAAEEAAVTIYCTSLRFEPATGGPGSAATMEFSSDSSFADVNGELTALFDPSLPTHGTYFRLDDPTVAETLFGQIAFDQPPLADANGNGFDDFYEVSQAVSGSTSGKFTVPGVEDGTVRATWSRAADSTTGTCSLQLTGRQFGELPTFTHNFELLQFTGTLSYVVGSNTVTGTLQVSQTQHPENTLAGAVQLARVPANRLNELKLLAGGLTNAAGQVLTNQPADLTRDQFSKTNYYGFLDFTDGDPSTSTPDYPDWVLSIDDLNDANGNGIPDLSDDPPSTPGQGPTLTLARAPDQLLLTLTAPPGTSYDVEETVSLPGTNWQQTASITLTNGSQTVTLALPDTQTRFWRARAR